MLSWNATGANSSVREASLSRRDCTMTSVELWDSNELALRRITSVVEVEAVHALLETEVEFGTKVRFFALSSARGRRIASAV